MPSLTALSMIASVSYPRSARRYSAWNPSISCAETVQSAVVPETTPSKYCKDKKFDDSPGKRTVILSACEGAAPADMPDYFLREHKKWRLGLTQTVVF